MDTTHLLRSGKSSRQEKRSLPSPRSLAVQNSNVRALALRGKQHTVVTHPSLSAVCDLTQTKADRGLVLGLKFTTTLKFLPRIRVECDMHEDDLEEGAPSLYRHVFVEQGCDEATYNAELEFSNEGRGVWASPKVGGARQASPMVVKRRQWSSSDFKGR